MNTTDTPKRIHFVTLGCSKNEVDTETMLAGRRLADRLEEAVRGHGRKSVVRAARYGTNASVYAAAGVPTVVFGPGSIDQAHTCDEWIDVAEVEIAAAALVAAMA